MYLYGQISILVYDVSIQPSFMMYLFSQIVLALRPVPPTRMSNDGTGPTLGCVKPGSGQRRSHKEKMCSEVPRLHWRHKDRIYAEAGWPKAM